MDELQAAAVAFSKLINTEYHIVIGKKAKLIEFDLYFSKDHFHHLAGLQKLKDNPYIFTGKRSEIFDRIIDGGITYTSLKNNNSFSEVMVRLPHLTQLECLMDSNSMVFKYRNKDNSSLIEGQYLLVSMNDNKEVYSFWDNNPLANGKFFCRSFFPRGEKNYAYKQESWILLYKEKINTLNESKTIQYNKLYDFDIVVTQKEYYTLKDDADLAKKLQGGIEIYSQNTDNITLKTFKRDRKEIFNALSELRNFEKAPATQEIKTQYNVTLSPSGEAVLQTPTAVILTPPPFFNELKEKITKLIGKVKATFISPHSQPAPKNKHTVEKSTSHKQTVQSNSSQQTKMPVTQKRTDKIQTEPQQMNVKSPQQFRFTRDELKRNAKIVKEKGNEKTTSKAKHKNDPSINK